MRAKANFKRGEEYFYLHRATLACVRLAGGIVTGERFTLYLKRPKPASAFHRCTLTVIRTKAEAKALNKKYAKLRAKRRAENLKELAIAANKPQGAATEGGL